MKKNESTLTNGGSNGSTGNHIEPRDLPAPGVSEAAQRTLDIQAATANVKEAFTKLVFLVSLNSVSRVRVFKGHHGVDPHALALGEMIANKPELAPAGLRGEDLIERVKMVGALLALHGHLASFSQSVDDTILTARAAVYEDTIDIYAVNQRNARRDPSLREHLAAFKQFLALGPRPKKAKPATPVIAATNGGASAHSDSGAAAPAAEPPMPATPVVPSAAST